MYISVLSHFTEGVSEVQRGWVLYPNSHSMYRVEPGWRARQTVPEPLLFATMSYLPPGSGYPRTSGSFLISLSYDICSSARSWSSTAVKSTVPQSWWPWIQILTSALIGRVSLSKPSNLSEPRFAHLQNGNDNRTHLTESLWRINQ